MDLIGQERELILCNKSTLKVFDLSIFKSMSELRSFLNKKSGIYLWYNLVSHRIYIGSSINLWHRFLSYKNAFFYGKTIRFNDKFLNSIKKHGSNNFKFFIIEMFDGTMVDLRKLEELYINKFETYKRNGYNVARHCLVYVRPNLTDEIRKIISESNTGENSSNAILDNLKVIDIKEKLCKGVKLKHLAKEFNVSTTVISNIKRGLTWSHIKVSDELELKLKELVEKDKRLNLSEDVVRSIKREVLAGGKMKEIAKKYGVGYTCVTGLKYGCFYKDITP